MRKWTQTKHRHIPAATHRIGWIHRQRADIWPAGVRDMPATYPVQLANSRFTAGCQPTSQMGPGCSQFAWHPAGFSICPTSGPSPGRSAKQNFTTNHSSTLHKKQGLATGIPRNIDILTHILQSLPTFGQSPRGHRIAKKSCIEKMH
jgi:hypothetical protein